MVSMEHDAKHVAEAAVHIHRAALHAEPLAVQ